MLIEEKKIDAEVFTNFPGWTSLLWKRKKWLLREKRSPASLEFRRSLEPNVAR